MKKQEALDAAQKCFDLAAKNAERGSNPTTRDLVEVGDAFLRLAAECSP